ncbi:hypothetical protein PVAG01_06581 [Phlyctema vagabunda]|uniref:Uncharacterized protein n=1 Tax=Phlyctema vagabunda TaxID=108571 RepID=A0ABR4PGK5_9HELO
MELWACGFNAWNQLQFEGRLPAQPQDLHAFQCILRDDDITILKTSLSATLVQTSSGRCQMAGLPDESLQYCTEKGHGCKSVAIAGNEKVAAVSESRIAQYDSLQAYLVEDGHVLEEDADIAAIAANQTTFTALSKDGTVLTWGDSRYEACLGRDVSEDSPASIPSIVHDLSDLPTGPVVKIVSGGYITAALTAGADVYIWGGRSGQSRLLDDLSGAPAPLDVEGQDILDIAVGNDHLVVLTTEHELFVVGEGRNGQLGVKTKRLTEWTQVVLPLGKNQRIVGITAGYKNSFVLVKDQEVNGT